MFPVAILLLQTTITPVEESQPSTKQKPQLRACDLLPPISSPITHLYRQGSADGFLSYFRFTREVFHMMLSKFERIWLAYPLSKNAKYAKPVSRKLSPEQTLLLVLRFMAIGGNRSDLALLIGTLPANVSKYLFKGLLCLMEVLRATKKARSIFPKTNEGKIS